MSKRRSLSFQNQSLLKFLGYVEEYRDTERPLAAVADLDPAEMAIATSVAVSRGFIVKSNTGYYILTGDGRDWIVNELGPLVRAVKDRDE